jgi:hypothetical protein
LVWLSYTGRRLDWDEEHRRLKELSSLIINTSFQGTRVETSVEQRSAAGSNAGYERKTTTLFCDATGARFRAIGGGVNACANDVVVASDRTNECFAAD